MKRRSRRPKSRLFFSNGRDPAAGGSRGPGLPGGANTPPTGKDDRDPPTVRGFSRTVPIRSLERSPAGTPEDTRPLRVGTIERPGSTAAFSPAVRPNGGDAPRNRRDAWSPAGGVRDDAGGPGFRARHPRPGRRVAPGGRAARVAGPEAVPSMNEIPAKTFSRTGSVSAQRSSRTVAVMTTWAPRSG